MATDNSFLQVICDCPDDDGPRLIYADWLEENGKSGEAEFIRIQCKLARVPKYDPLWVTCWERDRNWISGWLLNREQPRLPSEMLRWGAFAYRRGFLWRLEVLDLGVFLDHAPALFCLAPIQALRVDARKRPDLAPLAASPWLGRLTTLEFNLAEFGAEPILRLANSSNADRLTELTFEFAGIAADGLLALVNSQLIRRICNLNLRSNFFVEFGGPLGAAFHTVKELPSLESLNLSSNRIGPSVLRAILNGPALPQLTQLKLLENPLGPAGVAVLAASSNLPNLATLHLSKTAPGLEGIRSLVGSAGMANLRALHLGANRLGPVAVRSIVEWSRLAELRLLDLRSNPLGDNGVKTLVNSPSVKNLVSLDLYETGVGDVGARSILDSPHLVNLAHLNLQGNKFSKPIQQVLRERFGQGVCSSMV